MHNKYVDPSNHDWRLFDTSRLFLEMQFFFVVVLNCYCCLCCLNPLIHSCLWMCSFLSPSTTSLKSPPIWFLINHTTEHLFCSMYNIFHISMICDCRILHWKSLGNYPASTESLEYAAWFNIGCTIENRICTIR